MADRGGDVLEVWRRRLDAERRDLEDLTAAVDAARQGAHTADRDRLREAAIVVVLRVMGTWDTDLTAWDALVTELGHPEGAVELWEARSRLPATSHRSGAARVTAGLAAAGLQPEAAAGASGGRIPAARWAAFVAGEEPSEAERAVAAQVLNVPAQHLDPGWVQPAVLGLDFGRVIQQAAGGRSTLDDDLAPPAPGLWDHLPQIVERFGGRAVLVSQAREPFARRALEWLARHDFHRRTGIAPDAVLFVERTEDRAQVAWELRVTHFVDGRPEVLASMPWLHGAYVLSPQRPEHLPRGATWAAGWRELALATLP